jgi:hypothetical protein
MASLRSPVTKNYINFYPLLRNLFARLAEIVSKETRVSEGQSKAKEYRETAAKLHQIAAGMTHGDAHTEIVELAERFGRLAEHAERKHHAVVGRALPPSRFVGA